MIYLEGEPRNASAEQRGGGGNGVDDFNVEDEGCLLGPLIFFFFGSTADLLCWTSLSGRSRDLSIL